MGAPATPAENPTGATGGDEPEANLEVVMEVFRLGMTSGDG